MILAIDVESSNLPPKGIEPGDAQFPWCVSVGAVLFDFDGRNKSVFYSPIRADGRSIATGASAVHGISSKDAGKSGVPEIVALGTICAMASEARYLTGYNAGFDRSILESTLIRLGKDTRKLMRPGLTLIDLMKPSTAFCKIPSERDSGEYRWPKLDAAIVSVLDEMPREGQHNALEDALLAKRLFLSLYARGALDIAEAA